MKKSIFRRLCLMSVLVTLFLYGFGQSALNVSGGTMTNANVSMKVEYAIGEAMAVPSDPKAQLTLGSGVIQPTYSVQTETNEVFDKQFKFSVFPNPTTEGIWIETDFKGFQTFDIFAMNGALLRSMSVDYSIIPFQDYPNGTYILVLRGVNKTVFKSTKIIKQ